jgi:hypothetical protein
MKAVLLRGSLSLNPATAPHGSRGPPAAGLPHQDPTVGWSMSVLTRAVLQRGDGHPSPPGVRKDGYIVRSVQAIPAAALTPH